MNVTKAHSLARDLMNLHGYGHVPFEFDRGKRRIAATHFTGVRTVHGAAKVLKVSLSEHFARLLTEAEIREAILHEIAHVKAGHEAGHGPRFVAAARSLGIKGTRCMTTTAKPVGAWVGTCPKGHTTDMHKAPQRVRSCGQCSRSFRWENVLTWRKHGRVVPLAQMPTKYQAEFNKLSLRYALTRNR